MQHVEFPVADVEGVSVFEFVHAIEFARVRAVAIVGYVDIASEPPRAGDVVSVCMHVRDAHDQEVVSVDGTEIFVDVLGRVNDDGLAAVVNGGRDAHPVPGRTTCTMPGTAR